MDPALIRLINAAAERERESLQRRDFDLRRERFLVHASRRRFRRRMQQWLVPLGVAAALAFFVVQTLRFPSVLSFEVSGRRAAPHDWLTTEGSERLDVTFSDGSHVGLTGDARARVADLHRDGARVVLERGALQADVAHRQGTSWRFDAGPFSVRVLGTKFGLEWDPSRERFVLDLADGQVAISGPKLGPSCVVRSGQRLQIELAASKGTGPCVEPEGTPPQSASLAPSATPTVIAPTVATPTLATPMVTETPPQSSALQAISGGVESEQATGDQGPVDQATGAQANPARDDGEAAHAAVSRTAFEQALRHGSATELMGLADTARYAGKSDQATQALIEVRRRFPSSAEASQAAFLLGRVAADQQRAPKRGAEWFAVYLAERPGGAFASEALGRLLHCQDASGQVQAARASAARYLERYPNGPYSALARHILESGHVGGAQRDERRPAAIRTP